MTDKRILLTTNQIIGGYLVAMGTELPNAQFPELTDSILEITIGEDKAVWLDDKPIQITPAQAQSIAQARQEQIETGAAEPPKIVGKRSDRSKGKRKPSWDIAK
jgi:hypothetical protein